jgi:hypothetical protein
VIGRSAALPFDEQAERSALGSVLVDPDVIGDLSILEPDDFYRSKHRTIFTAIRRLGNRESPVDIVLVVDELDRMDKLEGVTEAFVSSLANDVPSPYRAKYYALIVKEHSVRREILLTSSAAAEPGSDVERILENLVSISPIEGEVNRIESDAWQPLSVTELGSTEPPSWLWDGYVAKGYITLFTGLWKSGKTTLLSYLAREMEEGGFLGTEVFPGKLLLVTEEPESKWGERQERLELGDNLRIISRPFKGRSDRRTWIEFVNHLARLVEDEGYDLVIIDALPNFWPVLEEERAGPVLDAVVPFQAVAQAGAAVVLCNHPAKSDGGVGNASRGSGALPAFVDFILEFRLYDPEHADDPKRRLSCVSRFDESRRELVLELTAEGYRGVGTRAEAKREDRLPLLIGLLPKEPPGLKADEIREEWNSKDLPKPGLPTLNRDLAAAVEEGTLTKLGQGVRGDPYRYYSNHLRVYTGE